MNDSLVVDDDVRDAADEASAAADVRRDHGVVGRHAAEVLRRVTSHEASASTLDPRPYHLQVVSVQMQTDAHTPRLSLT